MTLAEPISGSALQCPRCAAALSGDTLVCPYCGGLAHARRLDELARHAVDLERTNPAAAIGVWQECMSLLPSDSRQFQELTERVRALSAGFAPHPLPYRAPPKAEDDPLPLALVKTVGSMALSIALYMYVFRWDWRLAVGFVLLILVHEMGHVIALRHYGYRASPPIFIPFMGALINLRQPPRNAWEEAVIGIGGPVAGTAGALACYALWRIYPESGVALDLAVFGFMLNFFNMLPVPPLDGGRVTAAISPWAWLLGLAAMGFWVIHDYVAYGRTNVLMLVIVFIALPRIRETLRARAARNTPYYAIGRRASWTMGVAYVCLTIVLAVFYFGNKTAVFGR